MYSNRDITGPINLETPNEFEMLEHAEKVLSIVGSFSNIIFKELPHDGPRQSQSNITKAKYILHWKPSVQLDDRL